MIFADLSVKSQPIVLKFCKHHFQGDYHENLIEKYLYSLRASLFNM